MDEAAVLRHRQLLRARHKDAAVGQIQDRRIHGKGIVLVLVSDTWYISVI